MTRKPPQTFACPHCGAVVRAGRLSCPECGSDAGTGWQAPDEVSYHSVDIPETFEEMEARYDAGETGLDRGTTAKPWVVLTALVVVAALLVWALRVAW